MKKRVFNLIILDESGSMHSIRRQAIDGVNETVQTIREAQKSHTDQEHYVTLVAFNSAEVKTIYDRAEAAGAEELTEGQYCPSCGTPLYDAMGDSLTRLSHCVADNDAVLVTVITDGYENASHEYSRQAIKALVESLKTKGWLFTYIGANQDVESVASELSIGNSLSFQATADGTAKMFARERKARSRFMSRLADNIAPTSMADDYFDDDEA